MGVEIQRKFLVVGDDWKRDVGRGRRFCQGSIARQDNASVRVRRADDIAYVTIEGPRTGISRVEFEYEIPAADAEEMLALLRCEPLVEKTRHRVPHAGVVWEVDVYAGSASRPLIAEVKLETEDTPIEIPTWIRDEVTGDPRYQNSSQSAIRVAFAT